MPSCQWWEANRSGGGTSTVGLKVIEQLSLELERNYAVLGSLILWIE